ncbi:hypothetical protein EV693_11645, partial [Nicoletella semolina]
MQKSVFSLKKSVIALAVLSVSGVGVANTSTVDNPTPDNLSVAKIKHSLGDEKYNQAMKNQVLGNIKTELELLTLNNFAGIAYNSVHANGVYKRIEEKEKLSFPIGRQQNLQEAVKFYVNVIGRLSDNTKIIDNIQNGEKTEIRDLAKQVQKILKDREGSNSELIKMVEFLKKTYPNDGPKDAALIAALKNQSIINQKLQELTVGSHKQLKLDIDRLDDVVKGHREEIN